jgi:hypothetical protein
MFPVDEIAPQRQSHPALFPRFIKTARNVLELWQSAMDKTAVCLAGFSWGLLAPAGGIAFGPSRS